MSLRFLIILIAGQMTIGLLVNRHFSFIGLTIPLTLCNRQQKHVHIQEIGGLNPWVNKCSLPRSVFRRALISLLNVAAILYLWYIYFVFVDTIPDIPCCCCMQSNARCGDYTLPLLTDKSICKYFPEKGVSVRETTNFLGIAHISEKIILCLSAAFTLVKYSLHIVRNGTYSNEKSKTKKEK